MGSNCFLFLDMFLVFQIDRGNLSMMFTNISPIPECAGVTGKAGENGQNSISSAAAHPGQDRRLPVR